MDQRLQQMLDQHEIRTLLSEYCHGMDRMDEGAVAAVYAAESWDDHGPDQGPGPQFTHEIMRRMGSPASLSAHHLLGQSLISVWGERAGADTYFIATNRRRADDGSENINQLGGRYVDIFVRESGRWKIKKRTVVYDWSVSVPAGSDWLRRDAFTQGRRSNEDPSFAELGKRHSGAEHD